MMHGLENNMNDWLGGLDMEWGRLSEDWKGIHEIIVYGFGKYAHDYIDILRREIEIKFIVDNSEKYFGKSYQSIPIYSFEQAKDKMQSAKIVILAETIARSQIRDFLEENSFHEHCDFTDFERFYCEWGYKSKKVARLLEVHTAVTTKCTFRCKHCNMFIPYYENGIEYSLEELKSNIDYLFRNIDYIHKYQIVGGEPFLCKELPDYLSYLYHVYRNRIGNLYLITNGSVVPDTQTMKVLHETGCNVYISDYTESIPYQDRLQRCIESYEKNAVKFEVIKSLKWRNVGFPKERFHCAEEDIRTHMYLCGTSWHGLADGKIYYCNCAWSAEKSGLFHNFDDDYLDIQAVQTNECLKILQLCLGDMPKGYHSFCKVCGGFGIDNHRFVRTGEQGVQR